MNKLNILISKAKEYKGVFTTKIPVGQTYFDAGEIGKLNNEEIRLKVTGSGVFGCIHLIKIHYILTITKDSKEYIIGKVTAENLKEYGFNLRKVYQKFLLGWFIMIVFYASIALKM